MTGCLQGIGQRIAAAAIGPSEGDPHERSIRPVRIDGTEGFEVDRHDPDAMLAGALRDELLDPRAEAADLVVEQEGQLVAAGMRQGRDGESQREAGVGLRFRLAAGPHHGCGRRQQRVEIDPDERRRNEPDIAQRRESPADVGWVEEEFAELVGVLDVTDAVRIGDRREVAAGMLVAVVPDGFERLLGTIPGIGQEGVRFGRRPRLGRDDDERSQRIEVVERCRDVLRVGRVEDAQCRVALDRTERPMQDIRREAAAAHPGDDDRLVALIDDRIPECLETDRAIGEVRRRVEPAEPLGDGLTDARIARPQRHVAGEEAGRPILDAGLLDGRLVGGLAAAQGETRCSQRGRGGVGHEGLRGWVPNGTPRAM